MSSTYRKTPLFKWIAICVIALLVLTFARHLKNEAIPAAKTSNKNLALMSEIKKQHGLDTNVSWKRANGVLEQVTVDFKAHQVGKRSYLELEEIAQEIVSSVYQTRPETLYIRVAKN